MMPVKKQKKRETKVPGTFVSLCDKFGLEGGFCVIIKKILSVLE